MKPKLTEGLFVHDSSKAELHKDKQLKQMRDGFYIFNSNAKTITRVKPHTSFAIKSARDYEKRRSEDQKMYGYDSLQVGQAFYFSVETDDSELARMVETALVGERHLGRSRSAQYGLVNIQRFDYEEFSNDNDIACNSDKYDKYYLYAEDRLIFLDQDGFPSFRPTPEQLGFTSDSRVLWEDSQVRTFCYAPWNGKRSTFDADRCGIEKGSVLVVEGKPVELSSVVGSFRGEGFGKVIINPSFLQSDKDGNAEWRIADGDHDKNDRAQAKAQSNALYKECPKASKANEPLLKLLRKLTNDVDADRKIYSTVNEWVNCNKANFFGEAFASQWGTIRSIAMNEPENAIYDKLFADGTGYLMHGVAHEKWANDKQGIRLSSFKALCDKNKDKGLKNLLVNLASQMAKAIRSKQ